MAKLRVDKIAAPIIKDEYTGSVYFDGSGDYLSLPVSSDFQFGSGDFTIECWAYALDEGTDDILGIYNTGSNRRTFALRKDQTEAAQFLFSTDGSSGSNIASSASVIQLRTWHHYAVVRRNLVYELYFDGVKVATKSDSTGAIYTNNDDGLRIGSSHYTDFHGYISNVRICKGHAVYSENFTPPTRELDIHLGAKGVVFPAADNRTVLLACQDAYNPTTEATGRHTITGAGNLGGVPGQNLVTNGQFTQNTNDWAATIVSGSISFTRDTTVFSGGGIKVTTGGGQSHVTQTLTGLVVGARYTFSADLYTPSSNPGTDVATISIVNAGYTSSNAVSTDTNGVIQRKSFTFTASSTSQVIYLSVVRANYATFAPSGSIGYFDNISVIVVTPTSEANPGLLRKTNVTSTITETTGSVYFDGGDDGLRTTPYDELTLGTGALTIECWFWRQNITDTWQVLVADNLYQSAGGWSLYTNTDDIRFYKGGAQIFIVSNCYSAQTWTHIAVQRDSAGRWFCYINGIDQGVSATDGVDFTDNRICIGTNNYNSNYPNEYNYKGYISNVRICKGHTVYKSNFTPPTTELEVHPETVLLACYDGENVFAEKTGKFIAANGGRTSSPTPTATDRPIGITTFQPELTREVDPTAGPTFQGGVGFVSQNWLTLPKGTTTERYAGSNSANPAPRGLRASGQVAPNNAITNTVDSVEIATTGDALDFGDLINSKFGAGGIGSPTRGLFCGGGTPTRQTAIDYFTISTRGNGQDFGDITGSARTLAGATGGNATRGLTFGGATSSGTTNVIGYVTIASTGDSKDFGDCTKQNGCAVVCSPTRAVAAGGDSAANGSHINTIEFVTIQSMGNSLDFGDLLSAASGRGVSSTTRGLFSNESTAGKRINYVTIATTGNSVDFGDLITNNASGGCASYSSLTRGCFAGLRTPSTTNTIEYFTIPTLGDALDFGNLTQSVSNGGGCSNGHGGLG